MSSKKSYVEIVKYRRHFRIYFKNNHPAYIVGEDGDMYIFHRVTHSKSSGGRMNWEKKYNPIEGETSPMRIVKHEESDKKARFSLFEIKLKPGADVSYPEIKRAGQTSQSTGAAQTKHDYLIGRAWIPSGKDIKTNNTAKGKAKKKKARRAQTRHENSHGRASISSSKNIKTKNIKKDKKKEK